MTDAELPGGYVVGPEHAGGTLAAAIRAALGGIPWRRARELCAAGRVALDGETTTDSAVRVRAGSRIEVAAEGRRVRSGSLASAAFVHVDKDVVVVRKPAGVLTMPAVPGDRDTLADLARIALRRLPGSGPATDRTLGVVHRLDRDTSGLIVFARDFEAKRALARQFRDREVIRRYFAIAHGDVRPATFDTALVLDRGDGLRGSFAAGPRGASAEPPAWAKRAVTHVEALESLVGATLVGCRLETGRQHQIRIHLSEAGHMLVGETVYVRDHSGPRIPAPRLMLHAAALGFVHPRTGETLTFDEPPPDDFETVRRRLRRT